jgi:hypothetical protein
VTACAFEQSNLVSINIIRTIFSAVNVWSCCLGLEALTIKGDPSMGVAEADAVTWLWLQGVGVILCLGAVVFHISKHQYEGFYCFEESKTTADDSGKSAAVATPASTAI